MLTVIKEQKILKATATVVHTRRRTALPRVVITEQAYRAPAVLITIYGPNQSNGQSSTEHRPKG